MKAIKLFMMCTICMVAFSSCEMGLTKEEINKLIDERLEEEKQSGGSENSGGSTTPGGNEGSTTPSTPGQTVSGTHNGHDYVDLGLPSGTLWATCNVGANAPEEYGNYYAWGETTTKSNYSWATYTYANGAEDKLTKYCTNSDYGNNGFTDDKTILDLTDDAARANWGGNWRMPTLEEIIELNNCIWTWVKCNEVWGCNVAGPNGNSIFLPLAGYLANHTGSTELYYAGSLGDYWSSTLYSDDPSYAYDLGFLSGNHGWTYDYRYKSYFSYGRCYGRSVRPVCDR